MPDIEVLFSPTLEQDIDELEGDYPGAIAEVEKLVASFKRGETPGERVQGVGKPAYKVRLPNKAANRGKSGGFRTLVATNLGSRWFFVFGFAKNERANIDRDEEEALKKLATHLLSLTEPAFAQARVAGELMEMDCNAQNTIADS